MCTNEQTRFFKSFLYSLTMLVLAGALVLTGCDSNDVTEAENEIDDIADIVISPDSASIAAGESVDFEVVALTASEDTVRDATLDLTWWSTDATVFTVEAGGTATARNPGTALCMVEVTDEAGNKMARRFVGRDSAFVLVF